MFRCDIKTRLLRKIIINPTKQTCIIHTLSVHLFKIFDTPFSHKLQKNQQKIAIFYTNGIKKFAKQNLKQIKVK